MNKSNATVPNRLLLPCFDKTGRRVQPGDLLKVFHFRAAHRRRKIYMHKLVFSMNGNSCIDRGGEYLAAVDVCDIWTQGSPQDAHFCPVAVLDEFEIVEGGSVDGNDLFWERPVTA